LNNKKSNLDRLANTPHATDYVKDLLKYKLNVFTGTWNKTFQNVTLGGALTLRVEMEMIASTISSGKLLLKIDSGCTSSEKELLKTIFSASEFWSSFEDIDFNPDPELYPIPLMRAQDDFSFYSSVRASLISDVLGVYPSLKWNFEILDDKTIHKLIADGPFLVVHLKSNGVQGESLADPNKWHNILKYLANSRNMRIFLIGDDGYPDWLAEAKNVIMLSKLGVSLMAQLAIVQKAVGFIGSASGISASALYSTTPYLIFKDSEHHAAEMRREIGDSSRFSWSVKNQNIYRSDPNIELVEYFVRNIE